MPSSGGVPCGADVPRLPRAALVRWPACLRHSPHAALLLPAGSDWGGLGDGSPAPARLHTVGGQEISGDVVFKCVGVKPATALFAGSLSVQQQAPNGAVAVEPTLQVGTALCFHPL